jgi:hypothetical protein
LYLTDGRQRQISVRDLSDTTGDLVRSFSSNFNR